MRDGPVELGGVGAVTHLPCCLTVLGAGRDMICRAMSILLNAGLKRTTDFEWVSQLRCYWRDGDVAVDMAQVRVWGRTGT